MLPQTICLGRIVVSAIQAIEENVSPLPEHERHDLFNCAREIARESFVVWNLT